MPVNPIKQSRCSNARSAVQLPLKRPGCVGLNKQRRSNGLLFGIDVGIGAVGLQQYVGFGHTAPSRVEPSDMEAMRVIVQIVEEVIDFGAVRGSRSPGHLLVRGKRGFEPGERIVLPSCLNYEGSRGDSGLLCLRCPHTPGCHP